MTASKGFGEQRSSVRVLLVEDTPGDAVLIQRHLADSDNSVMLEPLDVTHVETLNDAIDAVSSGEPFQVILLDLGLPESRGLDTLRRFTRHTTTPIVVLTGLNDEELAHHAVAAGADDFLQKDGMSSSVILRAMRYAIDRADRSRELEIKTDALDFAALAMVLQEKRGDTRRNVFVNRAFQDLSGYSADELRRMDLADLFDQTQTEGDVEDLEEAMALGEKVRFETIMETRAGERFWVSVGVVPVAEGHGDNRSMLLTVEDVSARHELLTRLAEMDRMITLGTLSAAVAHEINNPLSFIGGNVQYSLREIRRIAEEYPEAGSELANSIEALGDAMEGSERVRVIVEDLRDLAGGGAPSAPSMKDRISVGRALTTSLSMTRKQVEYRADLEVDIDDDLPEVLGNASKLGQVVLNLVLNAVQAIPEDSEDGLVQVRARKAGESAVIEIEDNGEGIDSDTVQRIFEPFFSTKPSQEGTGLGLAICNQTVTRMGGEIEVESKPGVGTVFRVTLPTVERRTRDWSEITDAESADLSRTTVDG